MLAVHLKRVKQSHAWSREHGCSGKLHIGLYIQWPDHESSKSEELSIDLNKLEALGGHVFERTY